MSLFYSLAQVATAKESWDFWRALVDDDMHAAAWVGNEDGECSFRPRPGDHGQAAGIFQWWSPRRKIIEHATGIDVATASHIDQLKGAHWEATESKVYKHVWPHFISAMSLVEAVTVLVEEYEQSANPHTDINRRVAYANYWMNEFWQAP